MWLYLKSSKYFTAGNLLFFQILTFQENSDFFFILYYKTKLSYSNILRFTVLTGCRSKMHHFSHVYRSQKVSFQSSSSATKTFLGSVGIIAWITCLIFLKPSYSTTTPPTKVTYCSKGVTFSASLSFYCITESYYQLSHLCSYLSVAFPCPLTSKTYTQAILTSCKRLPCICCLC